MTLGTHAAPKGLQVMILIRPETVRAKPAHFASASRPVIPPYSTSQRGDSGEVTSLADSF